MGTLAHRRSWGRLIRQVYEVERLVCPGCGASMNVLAVIDHAGGIRRILSHLSLRSSGGQPTGPTSEGTKPGIRLLGTDALEIVHGTIPCPALALLRVSWELATERSGASRPRRAPLKGRYLDQTVASF